MVKYWMNNPSLWQEIAMSQAQGYANQGYFVVAGWINPNSNKSGHVVIIMPGQTEYNKHGDAIFHIQWIRDVISVHHIFV